MSGHIRNLCHETEHPQLHQNKNPSAVTGFYFCGVCLKKLEPILSRILTDFVRSACVVALYRIARSDCVVMRTNAPRPRSRIRADKTQKFSLPFLFSSAESLGGADKKNGKEIFSFASPLF